MAEADECRRRVEYRRAEDDDPPAIADVHVETWREAYATLLPGDYLAGLSAARREAFWRATIADLPRGQRPWVAVANRTVVGFASVGPSDDDDADADTGQLYAIYVRAACWGRGIGRRLIALAVEDLVAAGFVTATLWVLERNERARRFYERAGWRTDGGMQTESIGGSDVAEVRYRIALAARRSSSR